MITRLRYISISAPGLNDAFYRHTHTSRFKDKEANTEENGMRFLCLAPEWKEDLEITPGEVWGKQTGSLNGHVPLWNSEIDDCITRFNHLIPKDVTFKSTPPKNIGTTSVNFENAYGNTFMRLETPKGGNDGL